jgi:DNA-binding transcriptional MerR regulator
MPANSTAAANTEEVCFRIGAASRITGIPVDTLRIWERRYGVVTPERSKGADRLYKQEDIKRLGLLKKLVDRGHSIGSIAGLSDTALEKQLEIHEKEALTSKMPLPEHRVLRIAVLGDILPLRLKHEFADPDLDFLGLHRSTSGFENTIAEHQVDLIILEYPAIHSDTAREIRKLFRQSGARHAIVIYGFTSKTILESLAPGQFTLLQAPVSLSLLHLEIKRLIHAAEPVLPDKNQTTKAAPPRMFTSQGLVNAANASDTLKCECPQHLSNIIQQLIQFEIYSAECENRTPRDAEIHALLKNTTGHARAMMESALKHLLETEGIDPGIYE